MHDLTNNAASQTAASRDEHLRWFGVFDFCGGRRITRPAIEVYLAFSLLVWKVPTCQLIIANSCRKTADSSQRRTYLICSHHFIGRDQI